MESQIDTLDFFEKDESTAAILNKKAKEYLKQIKQENELYIPSKTKQLLDRLIEEENIVIEHDFIRYHSIYPNEYPTAHGGKVFGDGKIHIYEEKFKNKDIDDMESVMIHELFHYVISPEYSIKHNDDKMCSYIDEGLVDMYAMDFMKKHGIFPEYSSNYLYNVIFMRDKLSTLGDDETQNMLAFNGNIDQIIETTSTTPEEFISEYQKAKNHETSYDLLIQQIASFAPNKDMIDGYIRSLMRLSAKKGKKEALSIVKQTMKELNPNDIENRTPEEICTLQTRTISAIEEYLNIYSIVK